MPYLTKLKLRLNARIDVPQTPLNKWHCNIFLENLLIIAAVTF